MNAILRVCNVVYWLALTAWVAALVTAGIAAMNTFSRLPKLQIEMKQYPTLPVEQHGRLAAGMVMEGVFTTVDWIQIIAAPLAVIAMVVQMVMMSRLHRCSVANLLRCACVIIAAGTLAYHLTSIAPRMNRELHGYWSQLETGDLPAANAHLAIFNTLHPVADKALRLNLLLLIVAIAASAVGGAPGVRHPIKTHRPPTPPP